MTTFLCHHFLALSAFAMSASATAGAITVPDNIDLKLGARLHVLASASDDDSLSDRDERDWQVRRARLRFSAIVDDWITVFIQTEINNQKDKSGSNKSVIDANVTFTPRAETQWVIGQHMAPALRQNVTSSGPLLSIDRPALTYKSLNWGTRALAGFSRLTQNETDAGLRGEVDVRDTGATFFGVSRVGERLHLKYYAGIYEGAQSASSDHLSARGQLNWGDAESGYYNASSYLGKKQCVALGFSVDQQSSVAIDASNGNKVDYRLISADVFVAQGPLTFETAYINLDLDSAGVLAFPNGTPVSTNKASGVEAEGDGFYLQGGWQIGKWQPWLGFDLWESRADNGAGNFTNLRVGLSYHLNTVSSFKLGLERWEHEVVAAGEDAAFSTFTAGYFISF